MSPIPLHVVVAGFGMVGARFAEEIRRHDPEGRRIRLTMLAAEPHPGYNRVLLPNLLSGVMTEGDFRAGAEAVLLASAVRRPGRASADGTSVIGTSVIGASAVGASDTGATALRAGATVTSFDPASQTVTIGALIPPPAPWTANAAASGAPPALTAATSAPRPVNAAEVIGYDALVLATGARPSVPPLAGLLEADGGQAGLDGCDGVTGKGRGEDEASTRSMHRLAVDVAVLHSLGDARRIATFAQAARRKGRRIVVLGGGVLGLEAARALAARGNAITLVHRGRTLMERQLDAAAGRVLAAAIRRTGVTVELGTSAQRWEAGRGLWLADGRLIPAAGLVLCTGAVPETSLARTAGLRLTETGAVAVDDALATSAAGVYAIGDCAGHPGAAGGLVQPGWEQAAVLAARLTGASPKARYRGSGAVTRLKAAGIELTCVGTTQVEPGDPDVEVLSFDDPARERYAKLVLAQDRVAGAILIGLPDAAAGIVQLYDRDAPVPADRLALLLGRALPPEGGAGSGPAALPDYAVVCRCNMVTKGQLRDAWYGGACSRAALSAATRAATGCGTCGADLDAVASWLTETDPSQPVCDQAASNQTVSNQTVSNQTGDHQEGALR
jgi:assimilatory nitrate reductase electron transfer subunit